MTGVAKNKENVKKEKGPSKTPRGTPQPTLPWIPSQEGEKATHNTLPVRHHVRFNHYLAIATVATETLYSNAPSALSPFSPLEGQTYYAVSRRTSYTFIYLSILLILNSLLV